MIRGLLVALALFCSAGSTWAQEAKPDEPAVVAALAAQGDALIAAYDAAQGIDTADAFSDLYFNVFEASGMEAAVGLRSPAQKTELESLFADVIGLAGKGRPQADVVAAWVKLKQRLAAVAAESVQSSSPVATFLQSLLILLREGFEALLVVGALVAYLRRSGQGDKTRVVYAGVGWAAVASLLAAWLLAAVFDISGQGQEVIEGAVMLVAAVVLFYVSFWLISKREAASWQSYVRNQVEQAAGSGRLWTLGLAAFLAVFREGAETVLFYQALVLSSPGQGVAVAAGIAVATVGLALMFWAMKVASLKIPLKPFFTVTAGLLFYLALSFAGRGMLELQEGRIVPITPLSWLPKVEWLGLFPTVESAGAQLLLVAPMLLALGWHLLRQRKGA